MTHLSHLPATHTISDYGGLWRPFASTKTVYFGAGLTSPCPVSYTHLDVYKRQLQYPLDENSAVHDRRNLIDNPEEDR